MEIGSAWVGADWEIWETYDWDDLGLNERWERHKL
jgi:hypothetical protein